MLNYNQCSTNCTNTIKANTFCSSTFRANTNRANTFKANTIRANTFWVSDVEENKAINQCISDIDKSPWYIKLPFMDKRMDFFEFLYNINLYKNNQAVKINIFDAIENIYGLSLLQISALTNIDYSLLLKIYDDTINIENKIKLGDALVIPYKYFDGCTSADIPFLRQCAKAFFKSGMSQRVNSSPVKQVVISNLKKVFNCNEDRILNVVWISKLYWTNENSQKLKLCEQYLLDLITQNYIPDGRRLTRVEYTIDGNYSPHIRISTEKINDISLDASNSKFGRE